MESVWTGNKGILRRMKSGVRRTGEQPNGVLDRHDILIGESCHLLLAIATLFETRSSDCYHLPLNDRSYHSISLRSDILVIRAHYLDLNHNKQRKHRLNRAAIHYKQEKSSFMIYAPASRERIRIPASILNT